MFTRVYRSGLEGVGVWEGLDRDGLLCMICGYVLEDLRRRQRGALLSYTTRNGLASCEGGLKNANLVIANEPQSWCLVVLVICDEHVICPHLQEIALRDLHLTKAK